MNSFNNVNEIVLFFHWTVRRTYINLIYKIELVNNIYSQQIHSVKKIKDKFSDQKKLRSCLRLYYSY